MVDTKSIGGFLCTVLAFKLDETVKSDTTFLVLTFVGLSTIFYNVVRTKNEWKKPKQQ